MSIKIDQRGKVFRDPIHHLISIDQEDAFLLELLDTLEFQRLRRIRQLGVSCLTYPGAEHTRFNHSLGVLNFTQRIIQALERRHSDSPSEIGILTANKRALKAAALLHDIGHGPFSHMVERAFKGKADHAKRTAKLIGTSTTEVNAVLKRNGVNPNDVRAIIDGASDFLFLQDIVSSQLDADRMDYILRDAHFTGVRYGTYDSEWILNSFCLGLDPAAKTGETGVRHLRLCLDASRGLHSAEQFIIARYHMNMQVYFHRTTRGWEAHLLMLFNEAKKLAGGLPPATPSVVQRFIAGEGEVSDADFLRLDDAVMSATFLEWSLSTACGHELLARLADCFLRRKKLLLLRELLPEESSLEKRVLLRTLLERHAGPSGGAWILDEDSVKLYEFFSPLAGGGNDHEAILLSKGNLEEKAQPFEVRSMLFTALGARSEANSDDGKSSLFRLYYLPSVAKAIQRAFIETEDLVLDLKS